MTKTDLQNLDTVLSKLRLYGYQASELRMPTEGGSVLAMTLSNAPPEALSPAEQRLASHDDSSYAARAKRILKLSSDD